MRKLLTLTAISVAAVAASSPAIATVSYDFVATGKGEVTFTVDDFLTGSGKIASGDIDSCTADVGCAVSFNNGAVADTLSVDFLGIGSVVSVAALFPDGTFSTPGTYLFRTDSLTVRDNSAAPEPATWALMLVGFGATGVAMRRHRKIFAAA
jgi:PEP-CTERM motif-containing protein